MKRRWKTSVVLLLAALTGCSPTQPFFLRETGDMSHYLDKATSVVYPDTKDPHATEAVMSREPITLSNPEIDELWDLKLEDCIHIALANTKILRGTSAPRTQQGILNPTSQEGDLTNGRVSSSVSIYDVPIQESAVPIIGVSANDFQATGVGDQAQGQIASTGIEAALSTFDADVNIFGSQGNNALFTTTDRPQNIRSSQTASFFPAVLDLTNGGLITQLSKRTAGGGTFRIQNETDASVGNQRGSLQPVQGFWTTIMELGFTQPMLRNSGVQVNRTPIVLSRIAGDRAVANLEATLQKMIDNIEVRYWDLHRSYRDLETAKIARDTTQIAWRFIYERFRVGKDPAQSEAQAREQYFTFRAVVEQSLRDLHNNENELRFLMGLSPADGRVIRPIDEPTLARVQFDWNDVLAEALTKRPELRDQRWQIKTRELQLIVYRNQLLPQLDLGAFYRFVGVGDDLITANRRNLSFPSIGSTAVDSLLGGNFQEYGFNGIFTYTIGNRLALSGVRNYQLKLARDKAFLEDMELDVTHSLVRGLRNLDANYTLSQTQFNRWVAADTEVKSTQAVVEQGIGEGIANINQWLDAIRRRGQAQQAYYQAICEYNKSIADLHMRKGTILEYNGISFEEGPWPKKAYWDAMARARERDAGLYLDYGVSRPAVIARGSNPDMVLPQQGLLESLPAAEPTPADANDGEAPPTPNGVDISTSPTASVMPAGNRMPVRVARRQDAAQSEAFWGRNFDQPERRAIVQQASHLEDE
jgi:outer membrane protein TolC